MGSPSSMMKDMDIFMAFSMVVGDSTIITLYFRRRTDLSGFIILVIGLSSLLEDKNPLVRVPSYCGGNAVPFEPTG